MAAKPSVIPRWADVGGDRVEPTSGKKDVGFAPGEKPPAQYLDWLLGYGGDWDKYLSDGALSGNHTIAGTLGVTGAVDLDSTLNVDGAATIVGTSVFTGKATFNGDIAHPSRVEQILPTECSISATNITAGGPVDPTATCTGTPGQLGIPIRPREGEVVESIVAWITFSANAGTRTLELMYWNDVVGVWTIPGGGYSNTSVATSSRTTLTLNNTDFTKGNPLTGGTMNGFVQCRLVLVNGDLFWGARVTYKRT